MKRILFIFLLLAAAAGVTLSASTLTAEADSAYNGKNYVDAARLYQAEIDSIGPSSDIYYNLGNCYYRLGSTGRAVLNYERALKLDPRNADARANLEFINSRLTDRPGERGTFLGNVVDRVATFISANAWAVVAVVAFILFGAGVLVYFFTANVILRKTGFFGGGVMLLISILAILLGLRATSIATATDRAVIIEPSTILSTAPRTPSGSAEEAMMLHEGTVVTIVDEVTVKAPDGKNIKWLDVEFDNSHRAWINAADVAVI